MTSHIALFGYRFVRLNFTGGVQYQMFFSITMRRSPGTGGYGGTKTSRAEPKVRWITRFWQNPGITSK